MHYSFGINGLYVLYHADKDTFLQYCDELKQSCDKMVAHRIMVIIKEIKKYNKKLHTPVGFTRINWDFFMPKSPYIAIFHKEVTIKF